MQAITAFRWTATTAALLLLRPIRAMSTSTSTTNRITKIAVAQLCSTSCKLDNLLYVAQCAGWASHSESRMLFLPECFGFLGTSSDQTLAAAEPLPTDDSKQNSDEVTQALIKMVQGCASNKEGPVASTCADLSLSEDDDRGISLMDGLRTIARASGLWISAGGMHVAVSNEPRVYNTHIVLDDSGMLRSQYRKMHLFDVSIPGKVDLRESKTTKAGEELVVCPDSPIGM